MMKEKLVFAVVVKSKHILSDMFQFIRNALGMNLKGYENMIAEGIEEATHQLYTKFPEVYNVKIATTQVSIGAAELIVYGTIKCG